MITALMLPSPQAIFRDRERWERIAAEARWYVAKRIEREARFLDALVRDYGLVLGELFRDARVAVFLLPEREILGWKLLYPSAEVFTVVPRRAGQGKCPYLIVENLGGSRTHSVATQFMHPGADRLHQVVMALSGVQIKNPPSVPVKDWMEVHHLSFNVWNNLREALIVVPKAVHQRIHNAVDPNGIGVRRESRIPKAVVERLTRLNLLRLLVVHDPDTVDRRIFLRLPSLSDNPERFNRQGTEWVVGMNTGLAETHSLSHPRRQGIPGQGEVSNIPRSWTWRRPPSLMPEKLCRQAFGHRRDREVTMQVVYRSLVDQFGAGSRQDIENATCGIPRRTVDNAIGSLLDDGWIVRAQHGLYVITERWR